MGGKVTDLPLLERPMTKTDYDALSHEEKVALYWELADMGAVTA